MKAIPVSAEPTGTAPDVKLSCRNLWKVFGSDPEQFFRGGVDAGMATADRIAHIRAERHVPAVSDVSFDVRTGEIFVLMGLSGSGKSTVLRSLSSLVAPTHGEIIFEGRDLAHMSQADLIDLRRHKMGMVFQAFGLLPHLSVLENVAFPLKIQGVGQAERLRCAAEYLELVGLGGKEHAMPNQLSGGQQQRVGIARSLAVGPDLWFLDEPFSALDPLIRRQMQDEFVGLQSRLNKTIIFVTHDFLEALKIADRIAIMKDGRIVQIGTPTELVLNPADDYVAEFTADVPVSRVLSAGQIMEQGAAENAPSIAAGTSLEDVLARHDFSRGPLNVSAADGRPLGQITARGVVAALHRGRQSHAVGA